MPQFMCIQSCYTPHEQDPPKPRYYNRGEVVEFKTAPEGHFEQVESVTEEPANFETDTAEVLADKKWTLTALKEFMADRYDIDMESKMSKEKAIDKLMYARDNADPVIPPPIELV